MLLLVCWLRLPGFGAAGHTTAARPSKLPRRMHRSRLLPGLPLRLLRLPGSLGGPCLQLPAMIGGGRLAGGGCICCAPLNQGPQALPCLASLLQLLRRGLVVQQHIGGLQLLLLQLSYVLAAVLAGRDGEAVAAQGRICRLRGGL